ncbi:MAG: FecR domain-containing protein [Holophagales bacterium]|nr:FecR domain-containing protein [Holophagales bacterium]
MKPRLRLPSLLVLAAALLAVHPAVAQYADDEGDDGIRQSVARVSYFEGEVSLNRGDAPDDWQPASINYPMTFGDRLWAGRRSRAELQLRGARVYLGPGSELAALDLTLDVRQLSLTVGTATFQVIRLEREEVFEVATPNVSVTFETPGTYRVDVDEDGNSRVSVRQGRAWAAAAGGQVELERGDQIRVRGIDNPDYDVVGLSRADSWDNWVQNRARRYRSVRSASYVHPDIYGAEDLDAYGSWERGSEYGSVWYPRGMAANWEPYRAGRWIWRDPWGWTWLSSEPWGWAPYHYGRWAVVRGRWGWVPEGPLGGRPGYSPAVVGFVGGGAGWSVSVTAGGFVGWFPLAPREPFQPWWTHSRPSANVTNFRYAYRSRVTVVSRNVFVGGGRVDRDLVRDARVVREVAAAPILRGPIPVLPTRASIRVSAVAVQGRVSARPPERILQREVVTRTAPPQAPPSFDRKLSVIREKEGEPVPVDVARRLSVEEKGGARSAQPVRPAGREGVALAPRGDVKESRKPQPLPPAASRPAEPAARPARERVETPPVREPQPQPQPRRESEMARPTAAPPRVEAPAPPPARDRAPAPAASPEPQRQPQPEFRRGSSPTRPVPPPQPEMTREPAPAPPPPEARPERREPPPQAERNPGQPAPPPTVRAETAPAPQSRREAAAQKAAQPRPDQAEPKKAEPEKDESKAKSKPTPKPTKQKDRRETDTGTEPGKKND